MADEQTTEETAAPTSGGMKTKILLGFGFVALVASGIFIGLKVLGGSDPAESAQAEASESPTNVPALYTSLHPPLVVNLKDALGDAHFMQITMEVMARDQDVINAVREHTPVIRNALILLYGAAIYEEVTTRAGKEKMLANGLAEIQNVLSERIGEPGVEAVYFTSLIIQ